MRSALDAQPWGTVHVVVALLIVLAIAGVLVAIGMTAGGHIASLRERRVVTDVELPPILPAIE